jgi:hypothetical protein
VAVQVPVTVVVVVVLPVVAPVVLRLPHQRQRRRLFHLLIWVPLQMHCRLWRFVMCQGGRLQMHFLQHMLVQSYLS